MDDKIPADQAQLSFLLISGEKSSLLFSPSATIDTVCTAIFTSWPTDWKSLPIQPQSPANLKLLLRGKFLERHSTVGGSAD